LDNKVFAITDARCKYEVQTHLLFTRSEWPASITHRRRKWI